MQPQRERKTYYDQGRRGVEQGRGQGVAKHKYYPPATGIARPEERIWQIRAFWTLAIGTYLHKKELRGKRREDS